MGYTLQSKYASIQAMTAVVVYGMPVMSCIMMGADTYTSMWIGAFPLSALIIPPLILVVFLLQRRASAPRHELACVLGIVPGVIIFLLGVFVMFHSTRFSDRLRTSDCEALGGVGILVKHTREAVEFHDQCVKGLPEGQTTLLPACPGYDDMLAQDPEREDSWRLLQRMEEDFYCGGFCSVETRPLWTPSTSKVEPCSLPLAMKLGSYTRHAGMQITAYSISVLVVFTLWIAFMWDSVTRPGPPGGREASQDLYPVDSAPRVG